MILIRIRFKPPIYSKQYKYALNDSSLQCLAAAVLIHSPLTAATRVRYPASACEMVMWLPSQTGGLPPGTPVSSHTKTIQTQTSLPTSMMFRNRCKKYIIKIRK